MTDSIKKGSVVIFVMLIIVLIWRLPLTRFLQFNMHLVFMWFAILSLAVYIAASINIWVGSFLALALISAHYPSPTFASGEALLMVILGTTLYLVFYRIYNKEVMFTILCLFALANVFAASLQYFHVDFQLINNDTPWWRNDRTLRVGLLNNRNSLSAAFAFCLPAFFRPRWKYFIPVVLLGLMLAKSVGGVIASLPTLFYYLRQYIITRLKISNKIQILVCVSVIIVGVFFFIKFIDNPNYTSRWAAWRMYGELNVDPYQNKWLGTGIGHWKVVFSREDIRRKICKWAGCSTPVIGMYYAHAHNEFLHINFEMGLVGIALVLGFIINILLEARNMDPRPVLALLAIIINAMVYFPLHIPMLAIVVLIWLSMIRREHAYEKTQ